MQGAQAIDAAALAALADVVEAGGGGREDREEASVEQFRAVWNGLKQLNPGLSCTKLLQAAAANIAAIAEGLPAICGYKQVAADKSQNRPIVTRVHVPRRPPQSPRTAAAVSGGTRSTRRRRLPRTPARLAEGGAVIALVHRGSRYGSQPYGWHARVTAPRSSRPGALRRPSLRADQ